MITDGAFHDTAVAGLYGCNEEIVRSTKELNDLLCREMEGAGLFSVAKFRSCRAAGIYVISDSGSGDDWNLGWGEKALEASISKVIDAITNNG